MAGEHGGFLDGVRRGMRIAGPFARFSHEPWPADPMPTVAEHLAKYGPPETSGQWFDQAEADWYRMLADRKRLFRRYLAGLRCGTALTALLELLAVAAVGVLIIRFVLEGAA